MIAHFPPSLSLCRRRPQHHIAVGHIFSWLTQVLGRTMSTQAPKQSRPPPSKPRPSASLIIINPQNEILLVQRNPRAGTFAGAYVFPGGNFDSNQDDSLEMTAIRETFEETGLLLASADPSASSSLRAPSDEELNTAREAIHSQRELFKNFLRRHNLIPDTSSLLPFTQWVTPPIQPKRFRTQFYVAFLDATPSAGFHSGIKQERLPTPDGGQEVIEARFLRPAEVLHSNQSRQISLYPPQYYLLSTLSTILVGNVCTPEQREKVRQLCSGLFGKMVINPRALPGKDAKGRTTLTYEGDETRGGSPGRLHRVIVNITKGGGMSVDELLRNFDIFNGIEAHAFAKQSKL